MNLAAAVHYSDRLAGTIDVVGISHFVTFLKSAESYRRDLRRVEYGDERDPSMREFLHRISPLTNARRITRPLFVVQGRNDPRVPWTEAEQVVDKVRGNGTPVWCLRAENEGHGFARKENADFQFYAVVMFPRQVVKLQRREIVEPGVAAWHGLSLRPPRMTGAASPPARAAAAPVTARQPRVRSAVRSAASTA